MHKLCNVGKSGVKDFQNENQVQITPAVIDLISKKFKTSHLAALMDDEEKYLSLMKILIKKGLVSPQNMAWIDSKSGGKAQLVGILKFLQAQGYYKWNKKPTNKQMHEICWVDFNFLVGIDTIKHTSYNDVMVDFIPPDNTISGKLVEV